MVTQRIKTPLLSSVEGIMIREEEEEQEMRGISSLRAKSILTY